MCMFSECLSKCSFSPSASAGSLRLVSYSFCSSVDLSYFVISLIEISPQTLFSKNPKPQTLFNKNPKPYTLFNTMALNPKPLFRCVWFLQLAPGRSLRAEPRKTLLGFRV